MAAGGGTRLALMCTLRCCDCVHAGRHYQSHYIEVTQGAIFMEQDMRFGLILGWLAILKKKIGSDYK